MSKTNGLLQMDSPMTDMKFKLGVMDIFIQAGGGTITRNAAGDISINQAAGQAGVFVIPVNSILERIGMADYLQEQYGGTVGPAGVPGVPPFTGVTQLVPPTTFTPKGIKITDVTVVELITGQPLTAHTIRVDKVAYVNNVANAISAILAVGANGLPTAVQANPYVTKVPITPANIAFNTTDNSELVIEIASTTQAGGTYRLYGVFLHGQFNFN